LDLRGALQDRSQHSLLCKAFLPHPQGNVSVRCNVPIFRASNK
jgi:hypothetical protein